MWSLNSLLWSDPDQSNELSVIDDDDESKPPDSFKIFGSIDHTIIVFQSFGTWIRQSHTLKV